MPIAEGTKCLNCGVVTDTGSDLHGQEMIPQEGDITICFYCGHIMAYSDATSLRELNDEEIYIVAGNPTILQAQEKRGKAFEAYQEWKKEHPDEPS